MANTEQKERWLRPLVRGELRSCFCMTEPPPGAGSDPGLLRTTARPAGDQYVIDGEELYITGALGAKLAIIMARMPDGSATLFMTNMDRPGITIERQLHALDTCFTGGHAHVRIENLRVTQAEVLGEIGQRCRRRGARLPRFSPARHSPCFEVGSCAAQRHGTMPLAADMIKGRGAGKDDPRRHACKPIAARPAHSWRRCSLSVLLGRCCCWPRSR